MRLFKLIIFLVILLTNFSILYSQSNLRLTNNNEIEYLDNLSAKKSATIYDAFVLYYKYKFNVAVSFTQSRKKLIELKIIDSDDYNNANTPLNRGLLAKIIATDLEISDSFFFIIFNSERYAYHACVSKQIMKPGKSTFDFISGQELIAVFQHLNNL